MWFQVLSYAQQSRESYNSDQISLNLKMQEYKRQIHQESRLSLNGSHGSPGECAHPFSRISNEVVDAVKESAANGKVYSCVLCNVFLFLSLSKNICTYSYILSFESIS